jgi:hypothetical protein
MNGELALGAKWHECTGQRPHKISPRRQRFLLPTGLNRGDNRRWSYQPSTGPGAGPAESPRILPLASFKAKATTTSPAKKPITCSVAGRAVCSRRALLAIWQPMNPKALAITKRAAAIAIATADRDDASTCCHTPIAISVVPPTKPSATSGPMDSSVGWTDKYPRPAATQRLPIAKAKNIRLRAFGIARFCAAAASIAISLGSPNSARARSSGSFAPAARCTATASRR